MPIFHGFGIGVSVHTELTNGMEIILVPRFNAKDFSKLIKKYASKSIAKYALPAEYEDVEELPKTKLGKIDYKKL